MISKLRSYGGLQSRADFNHITQGLVQLNSKCCLSLMGNLCSRALLFQCGASSLYLIVTVLPATHNCCLSTLQSLHLKWACFLYNPFTAKLCWWLTFSLSSGPFCRAAPHLMFLYGVFPSQEPEFWLSLWHFMRSLLTHSSVLSRPLWMKVLLCRVSTTLPPVCVICKHGEGAIPFLHPHCIIQSRVTVYIT